MARINLAERPRRVLRAVVLIRSILIKATSIMVRVRCKGGIDPRPQPSCGDLRSEIPDDEFGP
ncbi:hypothetical protein KAW64_06000, partial [bacterium]|nr:hypothetical protein [bacterium]